MNSTTKTRFPLSSPPFHPTSLHRRVICCATRRLILAALFGIAALDRALAEDAKTEGLPWEKGSLQLGGFFATFNSELTFGIGGTRNGKIDGEDLLGLDSSLTVFRLEAMYRPGSSLRNQIDFTYGSYNRDGSAVLSHDLNVGDQTFPVGAHVNSVLDFDLFRLSYTYAFWQNNRVRLGLGLGVYAVPVKYSLNVQSENGRSFIEGADTTVPLPTLSLRCEVQLFSKCFAKLAVDGMYVELSEFKGSMLDANLALEYRPWRYFGFGVGYNFMGVHVEGEGGNSDYPGMNFVGSMDVRFSGLLFYAKVGF